MVGGGDGGGGRGGERRRRRWAAHGKVLGFRDSLFTSSRSTPRGRGLTPPSFFRPDVIVARLFFMNERIQPQRAAE